MPIDFWYHLPRVPLAAALVVAAVILARRHGSRRATALAVVALSGLAGDWLFGIVLWDVVDAWVKDGPPDSVDVKLRMEWRLGVAREAWRAACVVLLVCAVVADRRPTKPSGPEADYRDPPAG
jgi:hypothetical protein